MSDETTTPETPAAPDCRSSIFEKTTPELRRKLDRAILNYDPASYLAIFKKYDLPAHGVSYTAFYCYARKLRGRASVQQFAGQDWPDDDSLVEALPHMIAQFLVEQIMANDQAGADTIYRLTLAHRAALENAALQRKHRAAVASGPRAGRRTEVSAAATMADESNESLLTQADRLFAQQQAHLDADKAQLVADLKRAQEQLRAAGDHQAAEKLAADIAAIMGDDLPAAAAAGARIPSRTPSTGNPFPLDQTVTPSEPPPPEHPAPAVPPSEISNHEISNPASPPAPNPQSEIPNLVNHVNPVHSPDAIVSTADDEFRVTPEERRRRELHRVMINFGLMKPDAPLPDST